jgi:hypothetical protein
MAPKVARGPGFNPLASIILLASGERRKSRKIFAVSGSEDDYAVVVDTVIGSITASRRRG